MLAVVAVATAWSGYQATHWDGEQAQRCTQAGANASIDPRSTLAGRHTLYDLTLFNQWLNARAPETTQLATIYDRRFRPECRPAFEAWLATTPSTTRRAAWPPATTPEYKIRRRRCQEAGSGSRPAVGAGETGRGQCPAHPGNPELHNRRPAQALRPDAV